jgi:hypothetical protein
VSLQDLQSVLQRQVIANKGVILVSEATLADASLAPSPGFDRILRSHLSLKGPLSVAVTGQISSPSNSHLTVNGTASFLGVTAVSVQIVFTLETNNTVDALVVASLPGDWNFSSSFPMLVGFPFADLTVTQPSYLLTTAEKTSFTWNNHQLSLIQGLNFACFLGMDRSLSILEYLIESLKPGERVVFTGTIDPNGIADLTTGTPVMSLTGTIDAEITAHTHFDLSFPEVLLTSHPDENGHLAYWLSFSSTLSVESKPFSTFQAAIIQDSPNLYLSMLPTTNAITAPEIAKLIGVDYTKSIPPALESIFDAVGLVGLNATINVKTMDVLALGGSIGTTSPWTMGQFEIKNIVLSCQVLMGFKSELVTFTATASIFPKIFNGEFVVEINYDVTSKEMVIAANYLGTVKLHALVAGLSDNTIIIPPGHLNIEFDDFGMTFTKSEAGYDYTLYGSARETFNITLAGSPIVADLQVKVDSSTKSYTLIGGLTLGDSYFQAEVELTETKKVLTASWTALKNDYLELNAILKDLGLRDVPQIPGDLDLGLKSATITYDFTDEIFLMTAESVNYGTAVFVAIDVAKEAKEQAEKKWEFFFLAGVDKKFSLSNLPLVGKELAKIENIEVGEFKVIIGSIPATKEIADTINTLINALPDGPYPNLPVPVDGKPIGKVVLAAEVDFGNQPPIPISISLGGESTRSAQQRLPASDVAAPSKGALTTASNGTSGGEVTESTAPDGTTWFDIQKSFGPVSIQRIGVLYQSSAQVLWFEIDASLAFGPLSLSLEGLGIGSGLKDFTPEFSLHGVGVSYSEPPLTIAGELVNLNPPGAPGVQFEGGLVISTGEFTVQAFGYYGDSSGFTSMFIFGDIAYDFGGPPAFFVTGLALGFGYNSEVTIPTIDEVATFPFIQVLPTSTVGNPKLLGGPNAPPLDVLNKILDPNFHNPAWVHEEKGSLWLAAGITFTSFELVNSQALLMVDAGSELVIALVGTSRAQFPQAGGEVVYANIELDLLVRFAPSEGIFSLQAVLASSSFLLDRACVLTGGFAFFVWFEGDPNSQGSKHAGDFVLTLGGYNPGFTPPTHYPQVAPVGFHWTMDSTITIQGGAYFALTPAALMVGGDLQATYQSGHIKAWFDAHADVIIRWKPFWFDADIGLTIGASYTIDWGFTTSTITVEVGCDLEFWGPPTGGSVTIDLYVISVTIPFGSHPKNNTQGIKEWADVEKMLPNTGSKAAPNVLKLSPTTGLIPNGTAPPKKSQTARSLAGVAPDDSPPNDDAWIVRGTMFAFSTSSSIPASTATVGSLAPINGSQFNVYPLVHVNSHWNNVSSALTVKILGLPDNKDCFEAVGVRGGIPAALWGSPPEDESGNPQVPDAKKLLVPNQLTGVSVQVQAPIVGCSAGSINVQTNLKCVELKYTSAVIPLSSKAAPTGDIPANSPVTVSTIVTGIASIKVAGARNAIFKALRSANYAPDTNDSMTGFRDQIGCTLNAEPLLIN